MIKTMIVDLPTSIKGFSVDVGADDFYVICINAKLSSEQQRRTYIHELTHILKDDFHSLESVDVIENLMH